MSTNILDPAPDEIGSSADRFLTAHEAAEFLNVPVDWVYEKARLKVLPSHKFGHYLRFARADLLA